MSVLSQKPEDPATPEQVTAFYIKSQAFKSFKTMVEAYNEGVRVFWDNPKGLTPAQVSAALGTDAAEVFSLHGALGAAIANIDPQPISASSALIGDFTVNQDGSVAID